MSTLLVDQRGLRLSLDGATVRIEGGALPAERIPCSIIDRIIVQSDTLLSSALLCKLASSGCPVLLLRGARSAEWAVVAGRQGRDGRRRLLQYSRALLPGWRERWAAAIIRAKIRAHIACLQTASDLRAKPPRELALSLDALHRSMQSIPQQPAESSLSSLMGIEGSASAAYFGGFTSLFAPALSFHGRNRRPPRDPVNACLSLAYTLATMDLTAALMARGYDPQIGYLHETGRGRPSLALDLIEPLRGTLDLFVWRLFFEERLRPEHFSSKDNTVLMGKTARRLFYEEFDRESPKLANQRARLCILLGKVLTAAQPDLIEQPIQ